MNPIRNFYRDDWEMITKKHFSEGDIQYHSLSGKFSILTMDDVSQEFFVKDLKIVSKNYKWLHIAFQNEYFWITAMFDDNDHLFQVYIDMTKGNHLDTDPPSFEDCYLDYVFDEENFISLDEKELQIAYQNNEITELEYQRTILQGKRVSGYIKKHQKNICKDLQTFYLEHK